MKVVIGFLFFLLFLAAMYFVFLQGRQLTSQSLSGGGTQLTGIRWRPIYVGALAIPEDAGLYVQFELDGGIKGHGGCNSFFGALTTTESGVAVGLLGRTRMACPGPIMSRESAFLDALQKTTVFELGSDRLQCLDEDRKLLVDFLAAEQTAGD